jgi:16S rRNA (adenine1518-N6/adenine1519-N6)-dimethyltransferase
LGPSAFSPPPKVDSAFISLIKRPVPLFTLSNDQEFLHFLKTVFQHRRKTITNNLLLASFPASEIKKVLLLCRIEPHFRPEQIHLEQFVLLFKHIKDNHPF